MDQDAQPIERRFSDVLEDNAQHLGRLPPFFALEPEEDRRLVREILIQRSDTDARLLGHPGTGEARRAFLRQNLRRRFQDRRNKVGRARLLGLLS